MDCHGEGGVDLVVVVVIVWVMVLPLVQCVDVDGFWP